MSRRLLVLVCVCVGLVIMLSCMAQASAVHNRDCSYQLSREARDILTDAVWPIVDDRGWALNASTCPLHRDNDLLRPHATNSRMIRRNKFRCLLCQNTMRSQDALDVHMFTEHAAELQREQRPNAVCLGQFCSLLRCKSMRRDAEFRRSSCLRDVQRRMYSQCHQLAARCFPLTGDAVAHDLNVRFMAQFCEPLMSCVTFDDGDDTGLGESGWLALRIMGFLLLGAVTVATVVGLCLWRQELRTRADLTVRRHGAATREPSTPLGIPPPSLSSSSPSSSSPSLSASTAWLPAGLSRRAARPEL